MEYSTMYKRNNHKQRTPEKRSVLKWHLMSQQSEETVREDIFKEEEINMKNSM